MSEIGEQVMLLHGQGLPSLEIAHRLGVAQSTVHYHLRKHFEGQRSADAQGRRRGRRPGSEMTRELVARLLAHGLNRAEVARRLGLAKSTVSYHARRLGETMDERFAQRFDWQAVRAYYELGHGMRDCMRVFGFSRAAWDDAIRRGAIRPRPRFRPVEELFASNTHRNRGGLKARLISTGLREARCEQCGISDWLGQPLSITLHHVNGDRLDNRLENLQLLCPNCHSQTDTWGGKNRRKLRAV
jgi:DNA-binding CsgD family transcriptional regulator